MNPEQAVEWRTRSLCRQHPNPEYWFPDKKLPQSIRTMRSREARTICNMCPVFYQCREYAISAEEEYGIWAAQDLATHRGRRDIVQARPQPPSGDIAQLYLGLVPRIVSDDRSYRENGPLTA